ncbi:hypothetical protein F5Y11DRAFT_11967 [Daldinia sp. FL1419]|nr:hypothetical protein F5Y11DRAFT_11967 [Daldinia sp. FL1419]
MRLCKALRQNSARSSQFNFRPVAPRFDRRHFADDRARHDNGQLASDREDVFKINPENKTVKTVVGDLPLSPVMDPTYWEAVKRHQVPKARPGKPLNSVERQLRANPFAKALASKLRLCSLTRTRLPSAFLQDFTFVAHPETGDPWFIPRSLVPDESPAGEEADAQSIAEAMNEVDLEKAGESKDGEPASGTIATSTNNIQPPGPSIYCLARQDVISSIGVKGLGYDHAPKKMAGASSRYRTLAGKVVWRQGMNDYILNMVRQGIVDDILYLSRLCVEDKRYYIVKCYGWDDVKYKHNGAIIWFGEPDEDVKSGRARSQPGSFATFNVEKIDIQGEKYSTSVAVHNMPMLLGREHADRIKKEAGALRDGAVFMLAGRRTTNLQLKLWKLQGYLADYTAIS